MNWRIDASFSTTMRRGEKGKKKNGYIMTKMVL